MAIEATHPDRLSATLEQPVTAPSTASASANAASTSAAVIHPVEVAAAVRQLQSAISAGPNPAFSIDYLSGLPVVTVRSITTGEVVFQLPDTRVVELARLIRGGASLSSLGLLNITA